MSDDRIVPASDQALDRAAVLVRDRGAVVAYPTETLYGLGVDALNERALERLLELKGRPERRTVPLLLASEGMLPLVARSVPRRARELMARHWPGPLTLVLPAVAGLPAAVVNERGGVGVRVSPDPVAARLVELVGRPVTATSANRSGQTSATTAVAAAALSEVSLVLDDGVRDGVPSAVVDFSVDPPRVLRPGELRLEL